MRQLLRIRSWKLKSTYAGSTCPGSGSDLLEDWTYDYKNRLTTYRAYNGSGVVVSTVSWTNDPLDRPVAQANTVSGSTTNYSFSYLGASDRLSQETLTGATSATRKYLFDALGQRATMTDNTNRYSLLYDPHRSVSLLVDQAGAPKASYGYTAYGSAVTNLTKAAAGFSLGVEPYRYTGKRLDADSNTLDMGARRFSRSSGRFLQIDQYDGVLANLGLSLDRLTANRYALAAGNPVTYVEVDGHNVDAGGASGDTVNVKPGTTVTIDEISCGVHSAGQCYAGPQGVEEDHDPEYVAGAVSGVVAAKAIAQRVAKPAVRRVWGWFFDGGSSTAAEEASAAVRTVTALTRKQDQALNAVMRNPNDLEHIFGQGGKHNLAQLTQELGGERAVVREAILRVSNESEGVFEVSRQIGSYRVTITGRMIDGVPRISNIWVSR